VNFDLIVVGAGPVGLAVALAGRGLKTAVLAQQRRTPSFARALDARVYALSPGNVEFLRAIGAWRAIPPARIAPVHSMRVSGDRADARIEFDAYQAGVPELAWTVEDAVLQDAMWEAARGAPEVEILAPAVCVQLETSAREVRVGLEDGRILTAGLVVGADGASSFVRRHAGISAQEHDYGQSAVVANFECEKPHRNAALQWFQGGPVLALLPLPGPHVSMIWSLPATEAEKVERLDAPALCSAVEGAVSRELGTLSLLTAARRYPLRKLSARRLVAPRIALVGDAAHVIHPLAGQGLNLGLQDARALASAIRDREPAAGPGDFGLLRAYERARAEPILAMEAMVDGLFRLFGSRNKALARLRNSGLNLTGRAAVLRNLLMRHAMQ